MDDGATLPYDVAVVCVGGRSRPAFRRAISLIANPSLNFIRRTFAYIAMVCTSSTRRPLARVVSTRVGI